MDQPPTDRLLERGMKNGMGILDGSRREAARVHLVKNALDVERREAQESALTKRGANVAGNERLVIAEGLCSQFRPGGEVKPAVEVLVQGQILSGQFPALVALGQARIQVMLCRRKEPRRVRFE